MRNVQGRYGQHADGRWKAPILLQKRQSGCGNVLGEVGGRGKLCLPGDGFEPCVLHGNLHSARIQPVCAQARGHLVGKRHKAGARVGKGGEVPREGKAVAHAFYLPFFIHAAHGRALFAARKAPKFHAQFAQRCLQHLGRSSGKLADGGNAQFA